MFTVAFIIAKCMNVLFSSHKMDFNNKVVIITGSASGLGEATALAFSKLKAKISLVDLNIEKLKEAFQKCKKAGASDVMQVSADLTKDEEVKKVVESTLKQFGRIDVLVNGAGIFMDGDALLHEKTLEVYDKIMAILLRAPVALTNLAAPALIKTKGSIINISSVGAIVPLTNTLSYCTAKAGLRHFTKCAALELAPKGVRVNAVLPGPVSTNLLLNAGYSAEINKSSWIEMANQTALKKSIDAEEIADMIVYLASDKARSITGVAYEVDAGWALVGHAGSAIEQAKEEF